jgi:hypothetical protein
MVDEKHRALISDGVSLAGTIAKSSHFHLLGRTSYFSVLRQRHRSRAILRTVFRTAVSGSDMKARDTVVRMPPYGLRLALRRQGGVTGLCTCARYFLA